MLNKTKKSLKSTKSSNRIVVFILFIKEMSYSYQMTRTLTLQISLDDSRSQKIAEVLTNKTAKKILITLSEKDMNESDIAAALKIPLNTVGYNIKKLLSAELIEKTPRTFWSSKGKRMNFYTVANKKIVISPKKIQSENTKYCSHYFSWQTNITNQISEDTK